jgi:hypothetical protein
VGGGGALWLVGGGGRGGGSREHILCCCPVATVAGAPGRPTRLLPLIAPPLGVSGRDPGSTHAIAHDNLETSTSNITLHPSPAGEPSAAHAAMVALQQSLAQLEFLRDDFYQGGGKMGLWTG